ncbi:MAG: methylmalonate-semialdehyde dehydrogenase (CoA acylating) [Desulfobacterales bacterium]|nr:MAG: methylmalonate-semialdehyde dehydrogenase (CoA acylating) [Desulfobacterales bacterium]
MSKVEFTRIKNFINGEWVEEKDVEYVPLYNPSTGEEIGEVPLSSEATSLAAVDSSYAAYESWRKQSLSKRMRFLFAMRQAMVDKEEELAVSIAVDQAKHISEARGEVRRVVEIFAFIYKPSTQSPLFMQKMGTIFQEIGLPPGVVNIVHGNRSIPETWYENKKMSGVCLVGSTNTAKKMAEACGRGGKRSMLLGGAKNFLVAMEDLNWDVFIENFLHSCYGSAGQRCLAGSVVAVVPEIYDELIERVMEASKNVTVGDAMDPDIYMGPVISAKAKANIENYIEIGIEQGSRLLLDGRNPELPEANKNGYFVGPTIFADVTPCRRIAQEEIFGPVVSIMKVRDLDDALQLIRNQDFGNGACIFTQNQYYTEKFIAEANVGMVGVNVGICAPHPYLPFGGIKDSHLGTDKVQGKDGIDFFTQNKVATVRFTPPEGVTEDGAKKDGDNSVRSCVAS